MKNYKLTFILITFFMIAVISAAMADATWPAQSTWDTTFGRATIIVKDGGVTGIYYWNDGRFYEGEISQDGKTVTGFFIEYETWSNKILKEGRYSFTISPDGQKFSGIWDHVTTELHTKWSDWSETWYGSLIDSSGNITVHLDATWPAESTWSDSDGTKINIKIKNGNVTGSYEYKDGKLDGTLSADGKFISGHWIQSNKSGRYSFKLSHDGQSFSGKFRDGEGDPLEEGHGYGWNGTLISSSGNISEQGTTFNLNGEWIRTDNNEIWIITQTGNHIELKGITTGQTGEGDFVDSTHIAWTNFYGLPPTTVSDENTLTWADGVVWKRTK